MEQRGPGTARRRGLVGGAAVIAALVALAGCGGGGDDGASAPARETGPGTAAMAPQTRSSAPSTADAAREYQQLVDELNRDVAGINRRIEAAGTAGDRDAIVAALGDLQASNARFKEGLMAIDFPPSLQRQADDLVAETVQTDAALTAVTGGDLTTQTVQALFTQLNEQRSRSVVVRQALGLPGAP